MTYLRSLFLNFLIVFFVDRVAPGVEISEDKKTYTFYLKEAYWSDGHPITAYDFEKSWKKILDPSFPALSAFLLFPIENAEEYATGKIASEKVRVYALDEKTLQVKLVRPTPYFLSLTAFPMLLPAPTHIDDENPNWDREIGTETVFSGPFSIQSFQPNSQIVLKKNESYWNAHQVYIDEIDISIISDETTALQMFEKQELDWLGAPLSPLPIEALDSLREKALLNYVPMPATTFCVFNTEEGPFANPHLRKAFSLSIDREKLVKDIVGEGQIPATTPLPPSLSRISEKIYEKNITLAKEEFDLALSELKEIEPILFYYREGQVDKRIALALQKKWEEIFNVKIELKQVDMKSHLTILHDKKFTISLARWIAQYHDPINLLERYKTKENPKNYASWNSLRYRETLESALNEIDETKRDQFLSEAEMILAEDLPLTPIYHWASPCVYQPYLDNVGFTAGGGLLFERCKLLPKKAF